MKASSDSEEAHIGPEAASGGADEQARSSGNNRQRKQEPETNGHLEPEQRRIYLILFAVALLSALVGLSLILVWMFKFRAVTGIGLSDANQLGNLHAVMMFTFMISLNMYSILIYRTHFMLPKEQLKWAHAILSGLNIVMSLLGVFAMLKSHWIKGIPNFYSLHSWIGATTNAFYLTQFVTGFVSFLMPGLAEHRRAKIMPWHRLSGAVILVLAAAAALTGMTEMIIFQDQDHSYSSFAPITFVVNFAGVSVILMTAITIYLVTAPHWRRPKLPEEEPLKR